MFWSQKPKILVFSDGFWTGKHWVHACSSDIFNYDVYTVERLKAYMYVKIVLAELGCILWKAKYEGRMTISFGYDTI